ncbi:MAG: 2-oxo acid dehydrogenase subunit E2, partial [Gammaproteobacteria bacterium]|nr:2-oxo acid dehydrogenase subunit E2 [Gammaproteobacteria bacterium]
PPPPPPPPPPPGGPPPPPGGAGAPVYAGPATRRLARELGVDLSEVAATGARGRIVKDDVKAYVKQRLTSGDGALPRLPTIDFSRFGETETMPLSRIRTAGAQNLHRSWLNLPHVTQHDEVDVTELEAHRAGLKAEAAERGASLSPLPFLIKACCLALKEFPTFNASLDASGSQFILKRYYHIGIAVDTEQGLLVPVIRNADAKGVWDLAEATADLAEKARSQRLAMHELQGGSFSISSLGAIGGTGFTPIINAPEVAILGVGRLTTKPVWDGEGFVPRKMLPLSLSFDHRAINGAEAGRFLAHLAGVLGNVSLLE